MAIYTPQQLNIPAPAGGFQNLGWYNGRQYFNGTLSDPGVIHPSSPQVGAGNLVSPEVNAQSAQAQGLTPAQLEAYLAEQRKKNPTPTMQGGTVGQATYASMGTTGATGTTGAGGAGTVAGGLSAPINLPNIYNQLYQSSGISDKEANLRNLESQFLEAKGKITDNPFLSASMIDQRLQRLQAKYDQETTPLKNEIATKKADIETQLNLQTKQFDINSQSAKDALNYFNTLLDAGALDNASGEDIAQITISTGIPSSVIYSAIKTRQTEKSPDLFVDTFTADSGEVTAVTINKKTGEVISRTSLGLIGNAQGTSGTGSTLTERTKAIEDEARQALIQSAKNYNNLADLVATYQQYLNVDEIYRLYNLYSPFPDAEETLQNVREGKFKVPANYQ